MSELTWPPEWTRHAVCAQTDPECFFPEIGGIAGRAKQVCNGNPEKGTQPCPVRSECLDYALTNNETFGVWGGTTYTERLDLKRASKPCAECGDDFQPAPGRGAASGKYCSDDCRRAAHRRQQAASNARREAA